MGNTFLTDEKNKGKLNGFIVQQCVKLSPLIWKKQFCITNGLTNVFTDSGEKEIYKPNLISVLEEADNRIVCHVNDLIVNGYSKILVKTCDTSWIHGIFP